jgi:NAD(P)-dependent dehydrogenase (short-subunit alcohol dehydrogenase family)
MVTVMHAEALRGKVALVTGGASGIGRSTALAFATVGARVVVADVDAGGGEATVSLIREGGGEATFVRADVTRAGEVDAMVRAVVEQYGRLDCAFNNAGSVERPFDGGFSDLPEEEFDRVIALNLKGVWLCLKAELRQMLVQGGGAIVNTASIYGLVGGMPTAYVASKHGVVGLTRAAALQHADAGVRVNAVCPGHIDTPLLRRAGPEAMARLPGRYPMGRIGMPEEVAQLVVWLCSDAASFATGGAYTVDGGFTAQ